MKVQLKFLMSFGILCFSFLYLVISVESFFEKTGQNITTFESHLPGYESNSLSNSETAATYNNLLNNHKTLIKELKQDLASGKGSLLATATVIMLIFVGIFSYLYLRIGITLTKLTQSVQQRMEKGLLSSLETQTSDETQIGRASCRERV